MNEKQFIVQRSSFRVSSLPVLPGAKIGVLGSGQLGRMFAMAARRMGYLVHTFSPDSDTPTGQVADVEVTASYDDLDAVRAFAQGVEVVTFEFENVPAATVEAVAEFVPVRPSGAALHTAQHRVREKLFLAQAGFPVTPFRHIRERDELHAAVAALGLPCVLKTAGFGIKKDEPRFTAFVDDVLLDLEKSGEAETIFNTWFAPVKRPFTIKRD